MPSKGESSMETPSLPFSSTLRDLSRDSSSSLSLHDNAKHWAYLVQLKPYRDNSASNVLHQFFGLWAHTKGTIGYIFPLSIYLSSETQG